MDSRYAGMTRQRDDSGTGRDAPHAMRLSYAKALC